jgi:hypothetical protein
VRTGNLEPVRAEIDCLLWLVKSKMGAAVALPDRDGQSEAADGPGVPEPSAGILGPLAEPIWAMVGASSAVVISNGSRFCSNGSVTTPEIRQGCC